MTVRLYGRFLGHNSHARVTLAFLEQIQSRGLLEGTYPLDVNPTDDETASLQWDGVSPLAWRGQLASHGIFTGPLGLVQQMLMSTRHRERWVMVAPNSNRMPGNTIAEIRQVATHLMAPSLWAAKVLAEIFDNQIPVIVVPHGVHPAYRTDEQSEQEARDRFEQGLFEVLHLSTSERQRKGTFELVQGWQKAQERQWLPAHARLVLILDHLAHMALLERMMDADMMMPPGVVFETRIDGTDAEMCARYRRAHLVCQPSRGEAFGMIPLEALCSGVPVLVTACTGHSEFILHSPRTQPGVQRINTCPDGPIDDAPDATAPTIDPYEIATKLWLCHESWKELKLGAVDTASILRENWSWRRQLSGLLDRLEQQDEDRTGTRVGV